METPKEVLLQHLKYRIVEIDESLMPLLIEAMQIYAAKHHVFMLNMYELQHKKTEL